jgi:hypothetical protein
MFIGISAVFNVIYDFLILLVNQFPIKFPELLKHLILFPLPVPISGMIAPNVSIEFAFHPLGHNVAVTLCPRS